MSGEEGLKGAASMGDGNPFDVFNNIFGGMPPGMESHFSGLPPGVRVHVNGFPFHNNFKKNYLILTL